MTAACIVLNGTSCSGKSSWFLVTIDGQAAFDVVPGPLGMAMLKASHAYWGACAGAGLDQVIDDVWLVGVPARLAKLNTSTVQAPGVPGDFPKDIRPPERPGRHRPAEL
jgi:chloramphenicol 3-O-phosphotransferase